MSFHWPQILLIIVATLQLAFMLVLHGQKRKDKYSFWTRLFQIVTLGVVLYFGGFWTGGKM